MTEASNAMVGRSPPPGGKPGRMRRTWWQAVLTTIRGGVLPYCGPLCPTVAPSATVGPRSEVDHVAGEAVDGLLQRLGQRRVGVHVARELGGREVPLLREGQLGQQLGDLGADQVPAEQLAVGLVGDELDEPAGLGEPLGLAVG